MENLGTAITVSVIAMGVIFITLSVLIGIIRVLVSWMPYTTPSSVKNQPNTSTENGEAADHIAAIHAAVCCYTGKPPEEIQIVDIRPL
tara:strand:+ start:1237 stop:1500 length:264 start_codon:yes stop_codon:yes gene_type:complete